MVSISIINYKTPQLVKDLVESIKKFSKDIDYELIIIDNASGDNSKDILQFDDSNITVIWSKNNLGFGGGHNLARSYAKGEYIFFLNSDTLFYENSLLKLKNEFENIQKKLKIGFLQPRLFLDSERKKTQDSGSYYPTISDLFLENIPPIRKYFNKQFSRFKIVNWDRNSSRELSVICGAAMFCKTSFFDEIGKFDEQFFLYFEEYDICGRALKKGYKNFYTIETSIIHFWNKSPSSSLLKKKIYLKSFVKFLLKK